MNTWDSQLTEDRRELVGQVSSILLPELYLLVHIFNSLEFLKGDVFHVLAVYTFLALFDVDITWLLFLFLKAINVALAPRTSLA